MRAARLRLACLWVSQVARILADTFFYVFISFQVALSRTWPLIDISFLLPFIFLGPLIGPLVNCLPKRRVLAGSCIYSLAAMALLTAWAEGPLIWCVGLAAAMVGGAIYSPTRQALLPAVAADAGVPLSRVNGWIEAGSAAAMGGGIFLGFALQRSATAYEWREGFALQPSSGFAILLGLNVVALLAALPADFPADVRRPEAVGTALAGFFHDGVRTLKHREATACLFGLAAFLAIAWSGAFALFNAAVAWWWIFAGAAAGSAVASLQGHPRRVLGLVPFGLLGTLAAFVWAALGSDRAGPAFCLGAMTGLVVVALRATYQAAVPADSRGNAMALSNCINCLSVVLLGILLAVLRGSEVLSPTGRLWLLTAMAAGGCVLVWLLVFPRGF